MFCLSRKNVSLIVLYFCFFVAEKSVNAADQFLVSDRIGGRILRFNLDGTFDQTIATGIYRPTAILTIPGTGQIWVGSTEGGFINRYNAFTGAQIGGPVAFPIGVGDMINFHNPNTNADEVLVADFGGGGIQRYNTAGTLLGSFGAGVGAFSGLDIDTATGNLLVSSYFGGAYRFNPITGAPVDGTFDHDANPGTPEIPNAFTTYAGQGAGHAGIKANLPGGNFVSSLDFLSGGLEITKFSNTTGATVGPVPFINQFNPGAPGAGGTAYTSGMTIFNNTLLIANQGNNNPSDGYYGATLFNGFVGQYDFSGNYIGPFMTMPDAFGPTDFTMIPEPSTVVASVCGFSALLCMLYNNRRRKTSVVA